MGKHSRSGYEEAAAQQQAASEPSLLNGAKDQSDQPLRGEKNPDAAKLAVHNAAVGAKKPKRRMSTGLQTCARIERILGDLDDKTYATVLGWIKSLEPRKTDASTTG
jgi:hypothetical protein